MLVIGHRGASGYVAENTLESIQKALDLNVDGIEIDVQRCASGEIVVFHDKELDRLTNHKGLIEKTNFDEEEIAVILELLVEDEDWEKVISIMQSCRFQFKVKVPYTHLSTLI